ncbi:diguanylate cyclase and metal dependent phosphohydrolase [Alkaliphilus metalliredigens QYMF]|uniref:Diguanylate cyclase and metal dependent phosphohydrolase n=1 Tax=Alkaliphilus metalliredigens (strain QYMF) TaxID=293826 RepID=A6TUK4_ALKMQ|nr:transporter substrate-binding domain-containing protein [Alkaliphilus metalliredigens]ABR49872.1 diguanylate cyclase and metal dependent phosphohydrolase [Alkaliphilus metalliredigens QYMF]
MPVKKLILLIITALLLGSMVTYASPDKPSTAIIFGDDIDYPPFSFLDESGYPTGFNVELGKAVAEVMGLDVEFQLGNWHEIMQQLENNEIDAISGMFHSVDREAEYAFTARHAVASGDIFTRDDFSVTSLEDLAGTRVVVQTNDIVHESLVQEDLNIEFIEVSTVAEALRHVSSGEYDYAAVLKLPAHYIIQHNKLTNLKSNGLSLAPQNYSMAVHKSNGQLLSDLNEGLVILKNTGQYQEIYDQWLGVYEERDFLEALRRHYWLFASLLTLLFILLFWTFTLKKIVASRTKELLTTNTKLNESKKEITSTNQELEALLEELTATEEDLRENYDHLKESEEKYRTLVTQMHQGLALHQIITNELGEPVDYTFIDVNDSFERLTGLKRDDILGKTVLEVLPDTETYWIERYGQVALTGEPIHYENYSKEIDRYFEVVAYQPNYNQFAVVLTDVSERKKMADELVYLSYHDQLTGLYNRRFFEEELKRLDVPRNLPLSIMMADVNGLKLTNDAFGHVVGDKLLQKVATVLKNTCRADDIVARLGGDEFVILLPKTDSQEAENLANRIIALIAMEKVQSIDLSVSFGWETKYRDDEEMQEIFRLAEDYMYKKKLYEGPSNRNKTIGIIINTLHEKNNREEQHSHRVSELCSELGKALRLSESKIQELKILGLLHDIGKIAINESILNKPGKLTDDEWKEIQRHPEIGYRILSSVNDMSEMAEFVLAHHERWDGNGYPKGLRENEIPLQARIITVVDAYDAMTSVRSYKKPLSRDEALQELHKHSGTQFDPDLVIVFSKMLLDQKTDL